MRAAADFASLSRKDFFAHAPDRAPGACAQRYKPTPRPTPKGHSIIRGAGDAISALNQRFANRAIPLRHATRPG